MPSLDFQQLAIERQERCGERRPRRPAAGWLLLHILRIKFVRLLQQLLRLRQLVLPLLPLWHHLHRSLRHRRLPITNSCARVRSSAGAGAAAGPCTGTVSVSSLRWLELFLLQLLKLRKRQRLWLVQQRILHCRQLLRRVQRLQWIQLLRLLRGRIWWGRIWCVLHRFASAEHTVSRMMLRARRQHVRLDEHERRRWHSLAHHHSDRQCAVRSLLLGRLVAHR
jgi:hypothetical protein